MFMVYPKKLCIFLSISWLWISNVETLSPEDEVRKCMKPLNNKRRVIIDTDTDIDDLWAIHYLINEPTVDVLAITTVGNAFSSPFYSASNVLRFLDLVGCANRIPVAYGLNLPSLASGYVLPDSLLQPINTYLTDPKCLNESAKNIFIQPSPFEAVELIKLILKYSPTNVDILVLGTMTNIAAAISEDRSIVKKIGTLYFSGGQYKSTSAYSSLLPNLTSMTYPYKSKTSSSSSNVFLDVLAAQRVGESGIKNLVAMPSLTQKQLPADLAQLNSKLQQMNIQLRPFYYKLISSLAKCTNQDEKEINWWDNSAAQFMIQIQSGSSNGFCKEVMQVDSIYILAADSFQLFGQGMTDLNTTDPSLKDLPKYKICTKTDSDMFLQEFLTKIHSDKLYSCQRTFKNRIDERLQQCMKQYGLDR